MITTWSWSSSRLCLWPLPPALCGESQSISTASPRSAEASFCVDMPQHSEWNSNQRPKQPHLAPLNMKGVAVQCWAPGCLRTPFDHVTWSQLSQYLTNSSLFQICLLSAGLNEPRSDRVWTSSFPDLNEVGEGYFAFFWQLISLQKPNDQDEQMQIFSLG